MKIYYDEKNTDYILLEEIELGQGLKAVFDTENNELLIVDPDVEKDASGNPYKNKVTAVSKDDGTEITVGIVQKLSKKSIDELKDLFDVLELNYTK